MSQSPPAGYARAVVTVSLWVGAALVGGAAVLEGGFGAAAAGVAIGAAGSFAVLVFRFKSVSNTFASPSAGHAGRGAFFWSLGKMAAVFAVLSLGAMLGPRGAVGALVGLFTTAIGAVGEGVRAAARGK